MTPPSVRSRRTPRVATAVLGLLMIFPFLVAAGPGTRAGADGRNVRSPAEFHDPVANRTNEYRATGGGDLAPAPAPGPRRLAEVAGVDLFSISPRADAHGFHEGSTRSLPLTPVGRVSADERGIELPAPAKGGVDYVVMSSRGRATSPTSAVDVAVAEGTEVTSPVTGTVLDVSEYALYGRTRDVMVRIRPAQNRDVLVAVFHVVDPAISPGDDVVAGETVIAAGPRPLPFGSQIDRFVGRAGPHVHIQVEQG